MLCFDNMAITNHIINNDIKLSNNMNNGEAKRIQNNREYLI